MSIIDLIFKWYYNRSRENKSLLIWAVFHKIFVGQCIGTINPLVYIN